VRALHVNDAKVAPRFEGVPGILETPIAKGATYAAEVARLRSLAGS
jgi:hypothetical protein